MERCDAEAGPHIIDLNSLWLGLATLSHLVGGQLQSICNSGPARRGHVRTLAGHISLNLRRGASCGVAG